jgi:hypothetical protein
MEHSFSSWYYICFAANFHVLTLYVFLVAPQTKYVLTSKDVVLTLCRVLNMTFIILLAVSALGHIHPLVRVIPGVGWPEHGGNHPLRSKAQVKGRIELYVCTSTTLLGLPDMLCGELHLYSLLARKDQDDNRNTSRTVLSIFSPYLYYISYYHMSSLLPSNYTDSFQLLCV